MQIYLNKKTVVDCTVNSESKITKFRLDVYTDLELLSIIRCTTVKTATHNIIKQILAKTLIDNRYITTEDFTELIALLETPDPILHNFYTLIKPHLALDITDQISYNTDRLEDAIEILHNSANAIVWELLRDNTLLTAVTYQGIYNLIPAITTVYNKIKELKLPKIDGFIVCNQDGSPYIGYAGLKMYEDYGRAQMYVNIAKSRNLKIVKGSISLEEGLKFYENR